MTFAKTQVEFPARKIFLLNLHSTGVRSVLTVTAAPHKIVTNESEMLPARA
jgi:hypothetical protein